MLAHAPHAFRRRHRPLVPLLALLAGTLGCSACKQIVSTSVSTIGKDGGKLHSDDCGFTLVIPAGALDRDVPLVLQTDESPVLPDVPGRVRVSKVCTINPVIPFAKAAQLTISFDPTQLPRSVGAQDVDVRLAPSSTKEVRLQDLKVDVNANTASASTTATGEFFATAPQGPQVAEVDLAPSDAVALHPGDTQQYTATVKDDTGQPDPVQVTWAIDVARVASIDQTGLVTALAPGHATVTATASGISATADVYVVSAQPSPTTFSWENPLPQGNDVHGIAFVDGVPIVAANNGTVLVGVTDGGFERVTSARGLALAGAAVGGGRAGAAGTADVVQQGIEVVSGVLVDVAAGTAQTVRSTDLSANAVFGDDAGVIAVGAGNAAFLLRPGDPADAGWFALETPVSEALLAVDADPTEGRRVVGARGQVYRQSGTDWFPIWDQPLGTLFSQATTFGHDAYATDSANSIFHFVEGSGWQPDHPPEETVLDRVTLLGHFGDTLALGALDTALQPHFWIRYAQTSDWGEQFGLDVRDVLYATGGDDATRELVGGTNGALYQVGPAGLSPLRTGVVDDVRALAFAPDGSEFAATSNGCATSVCATRVGHLLARQNGQWVALAGLDVAPELFAVAARSAGDVFVGGDLGEAWHYDGTGFTPLGVSPTSAIRAMKVCGGDVWLVADSGVVAKFDGAGTFVPVSAPFANYRAISCTSATDVWIAGDYVVAQLQDGAFDEVATGSVNAQPWRALMVSDEEVWVAGETGYLLHGDRTANTWEAVQDPAGLQLFGGYGLWQSGPGDLYLVGSQQRPREAVLLRYDGAQWTALDATTDHELFAIDGAGPGDFAIGGGGGAILRAGP